MFIYYLFIFLFGILIGSFLNVCIYRIPRNESIAYPPSHCTSCNNRIKPYDLIPVISYIFLRGRCRYCGEKISLKYPLIESLTGVLFIFLFSKFGFSIELIKFIILICVLIALTFIDIEHSIIPLKIIIFALFFGIVLNIFGYEFNRSLLSYLYGLLLGGGVLFLIALLTGGMGGGDIQLMAVIGLYLGLKLTILTLLLSFIVGGIFGMVLIFLKIKGRKDYIPFGPWISLAAFISIAAGERIISWYLSLF